MRYLLRHKWFVFLACAIRGLIWRGIIHDLSKFYPDEFIPYANFFYGRKSKINRDTCKYYKPTDSGDPRFDYAWLLHQKRNKHHWQWWILPKDDGGIVHFQMPEKYLKEMLCDWTGAGRAIRGDFDISKWYNDHKDKIRVHPATRGTLEALIKEGINAKETPNI